LPRAYTHLAGETLALSSNLKEITSCLDTTSAGNYSRISDLWRNVKGVIKQGIISRVASKLGITKVKSEIAVEAFLNALKGAMKRGERIELRGFGVFMVKPRKSGIGRNPRTGEEVPIPPGKTVRFKPGKEIRFTQ